MNDNNDSPKSDDSEYFNAAHGLDGYEKMRGRPKKLNYTYLVMYKGNEYKCKTYKEIANITGLSLATIYYKIHKKKNKEKIDIENI